ncbi:TPA: hypothetical protein HA351_12680 [Methanosarcinaceae archaeon]|nr:hypothetical protein [Methanosarcinaceae archaeon]
MACIKCGSVLLVGKNFDDTLLWCPKCSGIEVIEKSEFLTISGKNLKSFSEDINGLIAKFSKISIVGSLCASLESVSFKGTNFRYICSTIYSLNRIIKKNSNAFGYESIDYENLQRLLNIYELEFQQLFVNHSLIQDGYVVGVKIPANKIQEYAMNPFHLESKEEIIAARFTEDWNFNRLLASRYGLYSERDLKLVREGPKQWSQKYIWNSELNLIKYGFQFAAGTSKLLSDLKSNVKFVDEIKNLNKDFIHYFFPTTFNQIEVSGSLFPTTKSEIFKSLSKITSNPQSIYSQILNFEFPLIVEIDDLCFVLPNTCGLYLQLLASQICESNLNEDKIKWGTKFEELVLLCLQIWGYEIKNPINGEQLLNFLVFDYKDTIQGKPRSFELDVAGFNENNSVIIECKHWDLGFNYFKRRSIEKRKKELLEDLMKFQHKIDLINNDEKYNFLTKDKKINAVLVTLHPEPIKKFGDIEVVSFHDFKPDLWAPNPAEKQKLSFKKNFVFSTRHYKNGSKLIGVDYTKSIINSYGIHHICIEPENEFKSYVFVGDGVVNSYDYKELSIETSNGMTFIVDLVEEDFGYLKSKKIRRRSKVRYQIYTKDALFATYFLRFITKI